MQLLVFDIFMKLLNEDEIGIISEAQNCNFSIPPNTLTVIILENDSGDFRNLLILKNITFIT